MKYAITGQKGLIGRELKKRLDSLGYECNLEVDLRDSARDIRDMEDWNTGVEGIDIMFHLAAHCKINKSIEDPSLSFEHNVIGTYNVLEFCRRNNIKKIVYFSSSRVLSPEKNPYVASKIYGEELVKAYYQCYGMEYLIIRPSTVYSPGDDKTHRLMNIWINNAKKGKDLIIYGDRSKTLGFTYIDDFLDSFMHLFKGEWNKSYNISGKEELLIDVAEEIIRQTNSRSDITFKSEELSQPQNVSIESDGLLNLVDVKDGIRRCL